MSWGIIFLKWSTGWVTPADNRIPPLACVQVQFTNRLSVINSVITLELDSWLMMQAQSQLHTHTHTHTHTSSVFNTLTSSTQGYITIPAKHSRCMVISVKVKLQRWKNCIPIQSIVFWVKNIHRPMKQLIRRLSTVASIHACRLNFRVTSFKTIWKWRRVGHSIKVYSKSCREIQSTVPV